MAARMILRRQPARKGVDLRAAACLVLHFAELGATTLLLTWGLLALALLALGGFTLDGLMHQAHNLARRYLEAEPDQTQAFAHILVMTHVLLAAALLVLRRHAILPPPRAERSVQHG